MKSRVSSRWALVASVLGAALFWGAAGALANPVQDYGFASGRPAVAVNPRTGDEYAFWQSDSGEVYEAWSNGRWHGPTNLGWKSTSPPAVAVGNNGNQYAFWLGSNGHIYEAWHGSRWHGAVDHGWVSNSAPAVAVNPRDNHQYVFWQGPNGDLYEAWYNHRWNGPVDTGWQSNSGASVAVADNGDQYVFWQGSDGYLYEAWHTHRWHGPVDLGWQSSSAPSIAVNPRENHQYVTWLGVHGTVEQATYTNRWRGPVDEGWRSSSTPAVAVTGKGAESILWQSLKGTIESNSFARTRWRRPRDMGWKIHTPELVGCVPAGNPYVRSGPTDRKAIALTFDDGPWYDTSQFLGILEQEHVPGTFFEIGRQISEYGEGGAIERRMLADGDMIGDHTWSHPDIAGAGSFAAGQISEAADAIRGATGGFQPCLLRPPYGDTSQALVSEALSMGYMTILWDIDPRDWATPGTDAIYDNVIANAHAGAIVIQHDGGGNRSETIAALPREIDTLRGEGYRFDTVTQLLGLRLVYR
jgi:peptidoglycan/xylan/chitin deacetylase (PgdA/CDA1 family)